MSILPTIARVHIIPIPIPIIISILKCFYFTLVSVYVYPIYTTYYTMFCIYTICYTIWISTHVRLHIDCYLIEFGFEFFIRISIPLICISIPFLCNHIPKPSIQFWALLLFRCLNLLSRVINFKRSSLNSFSNGVFNSFHVFILCYVRFVWINIYKYTNSKTLYSLWLVPYTILHKAGYY